MKVWQEDQIQALLAADDERKLFPELVALAHDLDFDFCAYGLRMPLPVSNPKTMIFSNYPGAWQARYQQKNYLAVDPTARHGMRSLLPILWSDDTFASARELWEDAQSFGLRFGWAQSSRDANSVGGMLTLARSDDPLSAGEMRDKDFKLTWLTQVAISACRGA